MIHGKVTLHGTPDIPLFQREEITAERYAFRN